MRRETSAAPSKQHDSHCTTANRLCQGGRTIFVWFDLCPVSHSTEAPSPVILKAPFVRKRRNASRFFRYGYQTMACPCVQSRTWQKRPRPSSSKPLSRGCDAELRGSFVMAGKPWPAPLYSSHTPQKRPQSRLSARFKRKRRKASPLLPLWLSKHDLPMRPVSHLAGAPSPLVLSAPFKRKRRKASRFFRRVRPQKTRNH